MTVDSPQAPTALPLPFAGLVVLDLTQIYNGPYATFLLAQAGATVVKVEPPAGEHLRARRRARGVTEPFAVLNANKRSVALDLKNPAGIEVFLELASKADVVVENFAPGVMDRLGLGDAQLRARNPRLIIASGSGYGSRGPYRDYPAMDVTVQAMTGVLAVTGFPEGGPVKAGPAVSDFFGGVHLYGAIVTALYRRALTGVGSSVEVAMMSAVYPSLLSNLGLAREGAKATRRTGNRQGGLNMAPYNVYVRWGDRHSVGDRSALGRDRVDARAPRVVRRSALRHYRRAHSAHG
jgi:CoA:oxalate CoA-transferase